MQQVGINLPCVAFYKIRFFTKATGKQLFLLLTDRFIEMLCTLHLVWRATQPKTSNDSMTGPLFSGNDVSSWEKRDDVQVLLVN